MEPVRYTLIRSDRKTLGLEITREGEVIVRSPRKTPQRTIEQFVREKENWIRTHLQRMEGLTSEEPMTPEERKALAEAAAEDIPERVAHYAARIGVTYGRITIRAQQSRWGSCSSRGNLNFNYLLMLSPPQVRDYVVVHELCHRLEMNHSPAFWAQVEAAMPDYRIHKKWLKDNGPRLMAKGGK